VSRQDKVTHSLNFNDRPVWFRALNGLWKLSYPAGTEIKLDKDDLIKTARKRSGHHDLGKDFREEPLDRMLDSIRNEAALHPVGRFITRERLINLLGVRLRAEYWFKRHTEILEQQLYPVILIMGIQRTGTTKLQRMLSTDPGNRVLRSWEAINPAPLNGRLDDNEDRIRKARMSEKALRLMAPGFFAIHPVEHLEPEEDILLLDVTFLSTTPEATMHVPSYAGWLEQTDQTPAYEYGAKLLKFLQWQHPGKRWVLKSPHHMEFLGLIENVFKNVHFIWTHRELSKCVPSFLSMVGHSRVIFSNEVELNTVADHWTRKICFMLSKGMEYRMKEGKEEMFTDILYDNFTTYPIPDLEKLYQRLGGISPGQMDSFQLSHLNSPQGKYGKHQYALEDFGMTKEDLEARANGYPEFFKELISKNSR
jgi:hypothetical protein